jgi:hypothetical protein
MAKRGKRVLHDKERKKAAICKKRGKKVLHDKER